MEIYQIPLDLLNILSGFKTLVDINILFSTPSKHSKINLRFNHTVNGCLQFYLVVLRLHTFILPGRIKALKITRVIHPTCSLQSLMM